MQIVKCPHCKRMLKLRHPVTNAKLQCRYCMKLFVASSYSDDQPLVSQTPQQEQTPDEYGELTDLVDTGTHVAIQNPSATPPAPPAKPQAPRPAAGHAPARPAAGHAPARPAAGHAPARHTPAPVTHHAPSAPAADDSQGQYDLADDQPEPAQTPSDDPFAALVGASSTAPSAGHAAPRSGAVHHAGGHERATFVKPKKSPVAIIIIICVAVVVIAGIIIAVAMNSSSDQPANKTADQPQTPQAGNTNAAVANKPAETSGTDKPANAAATGDTSQGQNQTPPTQQPKEATNATAAKTAPEDTIKNNLQVSYKFMPSDDGADGTLYGTLTNDNDMDFQSVSFYPIAVAADGEHELTHISCTVKYVPAKSSVKFALDVVGQKQNELEPGKYKIASYTQLPANQVILTSVACDRPMEAASETLKISGRVTNTTNLTLANVKIYVECFTQDGTISGGTIDNIPLKDDAKILNAGATATFAYSHVSKVRILASEIKLAVGRLIATKPN